MRLASKGESISCGVKARVMLSNLLGDQDLWEVLNADGVDDIAQRLSHHEGYRDHLSKLPMGEVHRQDLESALKHIPLSETGDFIGRLTGPRRDLLVHWGWRKDGDNIKSVLRRILWGRRDPSPGVERMFQVPLSRVRLEVLVSASTFQEVLEALKGTCYHQPLRQPLQRLQEGEVRDLFNAEMALDLTTEGNLYKALGRLDRDDRRHIGPLLGERWDLFNLYTIYRGRFILSMGAEEIMGQLLPHRHRLQLGFLRALAKAERPSSFAEELQRTPYGHVFNPKVMGDDMGLERNLKRHLFIKAAGILRRTPPSFGSVFCYIYIRELEVEDLITAIEDVRYDYDRRSAALYLSRPLIARGDSLWQ
ncbi:V-type ATPase subunit [Thermanaerovibrio acidaminovorans]|jgi:V/A-type H+-transporting ATPase subunit C|uniref:H+transporting two-sector ATPase C (AC39) subunit n=1 Tax=Thermanaerovibrio acidaminovorans (strain ATCC 49978 / DSM 6589 / Su883) TaxID=525903 RepID=D1B905_THEAS|nr:V-type ATPase subunit [Thermanaerovibrio acidaminovorans]ACZ18758.1 H+transporting two-sector ATPase C (AC39) subunit [Thermanaerovibrio acidaminovorans DSM 6589]